MLRNRSRAVKTKPALMADQTSLSSPIKNPPSPISSFLNSPRFFNGLLSKNLFADAETIAIVSPTSILDTKNNLSFVNPFGQDKLLSKLPNPPPEINPTPKQDTKAMGLALIDSIIQEKRDDGQSGKFSKLVNRATLYGSKLKVQIPDINLAPSIPQIESLKSPAEFGIKTKISQSSSPFPNSPVKNFGRQLSLKEMELSEDYTCVISHGPNPKTTHIFDNYVVESCLGYDSGRPESQKMDSAFGTDTSPSPSQDFLSFCHTCNDTLGQDKDIYIYRGEKAFCSHECRCEGMYFEGLKNQDMDA